MVFLITQESDIEKFKNKFETSMIHKETFIVNEKHLEILEKTLVDLGAIIKKNKIGKLGIGEARLMGVDFPPLPKPKKYEDIYKIVAKFS